MGVKIKADYIRVDVVGLKGQIIYSRAVKAHFSKSSAYIEKLTDAVRHAVDYVGADTDDILGVGITVPGILDDEKQILISAPPLKAKNYDFTRLISAIDYPVIVNNHMSEFAAAVMNTISDCGSVNICTSDTFTKHNIYFFIFRLSVKPVVCVCLCPRIIHHYDWIINS